MVSQPRSPPPPASPTARQLNMGLSRAGGDGGRTVTAVANFTQPAAQGAQMLRAAAPTPRLVIKGLGPAPALPAVPEVSQEEIDKMAALMVEEQGVIDMALQVLPAPFARSAPCLR
jgi:hypothetical protein